MLNYLHTAKRNLNAVVEPVINRFSLDTVDVAVISILLFFLIRWLFKHVHEFTQHQFYVNIRRSVVQKLLTIPFVATKIDKEVMKTRLRMREDIRANNPLPLSRQLEEEGLSWQEIDTKLHALDVPDQKYKDSGMLSGTYYAPPGDFEDQITSRSARYLYFNPLHVDKVPGIRQADSEILCYFLSMLKAPTEACGTTTCGGTESILLAILSFREYARVKKGITEPELILPVSAHSAFYKACSYFKIKAVNIPLDKNFTADLKFLKKRISSNTIGVVASAGNYPHGLIDPIPEMAKIVGPYDIPIHVDGCLGGYSMLFSEELGFDVPKFNFEIPEVASISIDPHKYGMAPKGISLVLFRDIAIKTAGIFVQEDWVGGVYGTPCITGSKPASSMIGSWIATLRVGKEGIRKNAKVIHDALIKVTSELRQIKGIEVIGNPQLNTFAFKLIDSPDNKFNVFQLAEGISRTGWYAPVIQHPSAVHFAITLGNIEKFSEGFVKAIKSVIDSLEKDPKLYEDSKNGQIYCSKMKVPDGSVIHTALQAVISEFSVA